MCVLCRLFRRGELIECPCGGGLPLVYGCREGKKSPLWVGGPQGKGRGGDRGAGWLNIRSSAWRTTLRGIEISVHVLAERSATYVDKYASVARKHRRVPVPVMCVLGVWRRRRGAGAYHVFLPRVSRTSCVADLVFRRPSGSGLLPLSDIFERMREWAPYRRISSVDTPRSRIDNTHRQPTHQTPPPYSTQAGPPLPPFHGRIIPNRGACMGTCNGA